MTSDPTLGSKTQQFSGSLRPAQALESTQSCAACPHGRASHDPIGIRFCAATSEQHLDRKCICAGEHPTGQHHARFSVTERAQPEAPFGRSRIARRCALTMLVCHTLRSSHVAAHAGARRIGAGECLERAVTSADWTEGIALRDGGSYGPPPRSPSTRSARRRTRRVAGVIRQSRRGPVVAWLLGGARPSGAAPSWFRLGAG